MGNFFIHIYNYFAKHKKVYWLVLSLTVLLCVGLASQVNFEEDISRMMNLDSETQELNTLMQNSKSTDKLIMRIYAKNETPDSDTLILIADSIGAVLSEQCGDLLKDIRTNVESDEIQRVYSIITSNFTSFVEEQNLENTLDKSFRSSKLDSTIAGYLKIIGTPGGMFAREAFVNDPAGLTLPLFEKLKELQASEQFTTIDNYLFSKDGKNLIVLLYPQYNSNETGYNSKLINQINSVVADFNSSRLSNNYQIQYFGGTLVAVGNAKQVQKDTYITLAFAAIILLILLLSVFQKKRLPLLILATVSFGLLFSLAMISLLKGAISLIAIGTGAVILGVAVNYPIHFFTHYLHNKDVVSTIKAMVVPMTIGSLTTIGGFLCLLFTSSDLLKDFGLFGAFCLVGAALFSLIFLPHLTGKIKESKRSNLVKDWLYKISHYPIDQKPIFIIIIVILTPILFYFSLDVQYESDMDKLNFMTAETKQAESDFLALANNDQNILLITKGYTGEQALYNSYKVMQLTDSLVAQGYNCSFSGVVRAIPPKQIQQDRVQLWNNYWGAPLKEEYKKGIQSVFDAQNLNTTSFGRFFNSLDGEEQILSDDDYNFLINTFANEFLYEGDTLSTIISRIKVEPESKSELIRFFQADENTVVLDKRSLTTNLVKTISDDFNKITWLTALLVFFAILLAYGRIELTLITFAPMVISWIWILGFMSLLDIKFNIVNIILSTFIFGLGDDFCIFTTDGNLKAYTHKQNHTKTIRTSVLISGITSLVGLGSLIFAKHPAIHSLAAISVLGICSVLFISQTLQPFLFRLLITNPTLKGQAPITLLSLISTMLTFTYFFTGCLTLSILSLLLQIVPMSKKQRKLLLHTLIYYLVRSLLYGCFIIRKRKINLHKETFKTPSIIIANHQSMLDILYVITLNPKIVLVVKDWVWKSPVMGIFVQAAGYHSVEQGMGDAADYKKTLDEGYSIVIFPEGTRSDGTKINRFHKGAFYLAEQFKADIIPIVFQNNYEALPKNSCAVYPSQLTMKIYPRISPNDITFGSCYKEKAKKISNWYKKEYVSLGEHAANTQYCVRKLRDAYMFKSPVLEWYLRIKINLENGYNAFDTIVPKQGFIVDAGCGYGFLPYALSFKAKQRKFLGIDYDNEKIIAADNSYIRTDKIAFKQADITTYNFPHADCYILSDVLHYISFDKIKDIMDQLSEKLNNGGSIIVRDADKKEHKFNRFSEFLSTKVFGFNKTESELNFFSSDDLIEYLTTLGFNVSIISDSKKTINTLFVFKRETNEV